MKGSYERCITKQQKICFVIFVSSNEKIILLKILQLLRKILQFFLLMIPTVHNLTKTHFFV